MDIRNSFKRGGGGEEAYNPGDTVEIDIPVRDGESMYQVIIPIGFTDGPVPEVREAGPDDEGIDAPFMVRERELHTFLRVLAYNKIPFTVEPM